MFKNKKVLLVGLGILGGGVATAKFLLKNGATLSITDKRQSKILNDSISLLPKDISYTLGSHIKKDFKIADIIVANPAVPRYGEWIKYAEKLGKIIYNDFTLFLFSFANQGRNLIAVTGTRGKTTTTLWIHHFLKGSVIGGNIPESGPLKIINKHGNPFVLETSSFQLEYVTKGLFGPHIALITNLYQDHLNRHKTMKEYARVKANIFINQSENDYLVLNLKNTHTKEFLRLKPKSQILFFSTSVLPKNKNGIYVSSGRIYTSIKGRKTFVTKSPFDTDFLNENLMGALLVAYLYKKTWKSILPRIKNLPQAPMRREIIINRKNLIVINDSAGTSPDATIALLDSCRKTSKREKILITGGTDKQLDFRKWAKVVSTSILPEKLLFLEGSATNKMIKELGRLNFFKKIPPSVAPNLKEIIKETTLAKGKKLILFSPSSASFDKFKNEFDRGKQFTKHAKTLFLR